MVNNNFEKCFTVRDPAVCISDDIIKPGKSATYKFDLDGAVLSRRHRLFFTGETRMFYIWKNEPDTRYLYYQIEDALNSEHANRTRYALDLSMKKPEEYVKRLTYELHWPPAFTYLQGYPESDTCEFSIYAEVKDLTVDRANGGYLRYTLEAWNKRDGVFQCTTSIPCDYRYVMDIPEGTYEQQKVSIPVDIPRDTVGFVLVTIEGLGYSGEVYLEEPGLTFVYRGEEFNRLPSFNTSYPDKEFFQWIGMNISKKEWPEFEITLNGTVIHSGELFERCHRYAEMEVAVPPGLLKARDNELTIKNTSNYNGALPYAIREVAIIEQPGGNPFEVIAVPQIADIKKPIPILLRTDSDNVTVEFESKSDALTAEKYVTFCESGLNVYKLSGLREASGAEFTLRCGEYSITSEIQRMIDRDDDGVISGTGDQIYINMRYDDMEEYISWFAANNVGELFTIRPAYRWGGTRTLQHESWRRVTKVLNDMNYKYAHMTDGRDLSGIWVNPTVEELEGEGFLGRQMHELDGQFFYWEGSIFRQPKIVERFFKTANRLYLEHPDTSDPIFSPANSDVYNYGITRKHSRIVDNDMKKTGDRCVRTIASMRDGIVRHTGPSTMSKYFYKAGFEFFGAELMYGSMEVTVSVLRGTAKSYGKPAIGAHHAMQWSSAPHDCDEKYRRYRLALYVGYMQGIHEINLEEGLWHIEENCSYFNRFTEACRQYLKNHQDFTNYIKTHTRRGKYHTPMAFIHGRYDGTVGFTNAVFGPKCFPEGEAEKGWQDAFKIFYPLSKPGAAIYNRKCPAEPVGYHTGTPIGNVDTVPLDGIVNPLHDYKAVAFVSYNMADAEDLDKLTEYMNAGGTLILSWAHLSTTTNRDDIDSNRFDIIRHGLIGMIADGEPVFDADTINGVHVQVCTNINKNAVVSAVTDSGKPLFAEIKIGNGRLIIANTKLYPHNELIRDGYMSIIREVNESLNKAEPSWIECGNDVQFTVYDRENGARDIYVLAVDWYNSPEFGRKFILRVGDERYDLTIPFGVMLKITVKDVKAVFSYDERVETDILTDGRIEVRGIGETAVMTAENGVLAEIKVDLGDKTIDIIS